MCDLYIFPLFPFSLVPFHGISLSVSRSVPHSLRMYGCPHKGLFTFLFFSASFFALYGCTDGKTTDNIRFFFVITLHTIYLLQWITDLVERYPSTHSIYVFDRSVCNLYFPFPLSLSLLLCEFNGNPSVFLCYFISCFVYSALDRFVGLILCRQEMGILSGINSSCIWSILCK